MKVRRKTIELRKLKDAKAQMIGTMCQELERGRAAEGRWRSRFLASGKLTRGKIIPG